MNLSRMKDAKTAEIKTVIQEMNDIDTKIYELQEKRKCLAEELGILREERAAIMKVMEMEAK